MNDFFKKRRTFSDDEIVLLLTGTIDSGVYDNTGNKITCVSERLSQYEKTITKYIENSPWNNIVFIENSNYPFDRERFTKLANINNKKFEFLSGKVCKDEVLKYGKSFGDAYLISEALKKSALLKNAKTFYKITGRIYLKNSFKIYKTVAKYPNEFIVYAGVNWCLTNIFKAQKDDYIKTFDRVAYECDESKINDIEIVFYKRLIKSDIQVGSFRTYPHFEGIMGATLRNYSGGFLERTFRNILTKLNVFTLNSLSSKIIILYMKITHKRGYK